MKKSDFLYGGKAKKIFKTQDPDYVIMEFTDEATAFDGDKKGLIKDKGSINARMTSILFPLLEKKGIPTHFVKIVDPNSLLVKRLSILPIEVVVRNIVAGSMARRLGLEEGIVLKKSLVEFYYKKDELHDPQLTEDYIQVLELATPSEVEELKRRALQVNEVLSSYLQERGILLVDFKLEFGYYKGDILLGDEISPDTCRFWDKKTREKLDKDRFRQDMGRVEEAYHEILSRVEGGDGDNVADTSGGHAQEGDLGS